MEKLNVVATGRWLSLVCASLGILLSSPRAAVAESELTWARVELTRNQVQLFSNGQSRRARVSDVLGINDALRTAQRARAELRFNDGSLARIGERAVFQFTPNTRNFRLSNGTVLLLIPPGRGRTTIQTPNAVTGIHGSALFVRFVPETGTTIIGALTNNPDGPIMAFNQDGSKEQSLHAGQMAVLRKDGTVQHLSFDVPHFLATSALMQGLGVEDLQAPTGDPAIDAVRQEIHDALEQQPEFEDGAGVVENPAFLTASIREPLASEPTIPDFALSPAADFLQQNGIANEFESVFAARGGQETPSQAQPAPSGQTATGVAPSQVQPIPRGQSQPVPGEPSVKPVSEPTQPIAPVAAPSPAPLPTVTPEEIPNQPVDAPTVSEPITPDNPVVPSMEPVVAEQPTVEPVVEPPEIVIAPEPTVPPIEVDNPTLEKPTRLPPTSVPPAPVVEPVIEQPVIEQPVAPVIAPVSEPVAAPIETPIAEPIAEPVAPVIAPVSEPIAEPVAPIVAPVREPIAEPVAPIVAPVSEPIAAPVEPVQPIVEPIAPIVAPVSEPIGAPVETVIVPVAPIAPVSEPVINPVEVMPVEPVVTPIEDVFMDDLGDITLIEAVVEPENEVQIDRLPVDMMVQEIIPEENMSAESPPMENLQEESLPTESL